MVVIRQLYKGKLLFRQHSTPIENTETAVTLSNSLPDGCIVKVNHVERLELQNYTSIALSSTSNISNNSSDDKATVNNHTQRISSYLTINVGKETLDKTHCITRVAAIRMIVFTIIYLIMNISVSVETVFFVIVDKPLDSRPSGFDIVHSLLSIVFFLFFGTVGDARKRVW